MRKVDIPKIHKTHYEIGENIRAINCLMDYASAHKIELNLSEVIKFISKALGVKYEVSRPIYIDFAKKGCSMKKKPKGRCR